MAMRRIFGWLFQRVALSVSRGTMCNGCDDGIGTPNQLINQLICLPIFQQLPGFDAVIEKARRQKTNETR
jgi:hypothetical protein